MLLSSVYMFQRCYFFKICERFMQICGGNNQIVDDVGEYSSVSHYDSLHE